ncbi:acetyltransferase [Halomonas korlensis]|uniref:Hexapeptide repeat of succinyl-transferase n=1 Tax=Halomonas korlensis TaxID=463301 RepID=A0A1I7KDX3_9GAMM|nr:acetyltransferase [Halomonas korlensis]SFU95642.1 Hexapeptide repeat of succinyl-transferase [Halomonas korlensis]
MKKLAVFGASGHGKVVVDIALQLGWDVVHFYDDAWPTRSRLEEWMIHGSFFTLLQGVNYYDGVVVAIGNNNVRSDKLKDLVSHGAKLPTLVHPNAVVSRFAKVEEGCVVVAGAVINAFARVGRGCIVNTGSTIDHDCQLGECVHIAPGANISGDVTIGDRSWVGVGASVRQGIRIGEDVMIGAGSVVVSNPLSNSIVAGVPARSLKATGDVKHQDVRDTASGSSRKMGGVNVEEKS